MEYVISNLIKERNKLFYIKCPICGNIFKEEKNKSLKRVEKKGLNNFKEDDYMLACPNRHCSNIQAQKRKSTLTKKQNTNIKKYGYKTFLETKDARVLAREAIYDKYGSYEHMIKKGMETYEKETGYSHNMRNPESVKINQQRRVKTLKAFSKNKKQRWAKKRFETYKKNESNVFSKHGRSIAEKEFANFLIENIDTEILTNPLIETKKKMFIPDILIKNKIIEFFGDYWHCNPSKFKKEDKVRRPGNKIVKVENVWKKDNDRIRLLKKNGYKVLIIWENNFNTNPKNVLATIKEFLDD